MQPLLIVVGRHLGNTISQLLHAALLMLMMQGSIWSPSGQKVLMMSMRGTFGVKSTTPKPFDVSVLDADLSLLLQA